MVRDGQMASQMAGNAAPSVDNTWDLTKAKLADIKFEEVTTSGITVRGDSTYSIYSVDETVLFDTDKAGIKSSAAASLQQITASIGQRYTTRQVCVMGFADSRGDKSYNRELSEKRAEAVKSCLVGTGKIEAARVSVEPMGETQSVASNATATGRKENRRVEIAVRTR